VLIKLTATPSAIGDVFNIGSQQEISIKELAEKVIQLTGSNSKVVYIPYDQAYEEGFEDMQRRVPDISKIKKLVNYKPTLDLDGILKSVIAYFKEKGL